MEQQNEEWRNEETRILGAHMCDRDYITLECTNCQRVIKVLAGSKDRTCPECAKELFREKFDKYLPMIKTYLALHNLMFVTLTWCPVTEQSVKQVRLMFKALNRLLHRKWYKNNWKAVLGVVECKKTPEGLFYYHIHMLVHGSYREKENLAMDWKEITGHYIVDIQYVGNEHNANKVLHYVLKYVLKGFNFKDERDTADFREAMYHTRLVATYGEWYNYNYQKSPHVPYPCPYCKSTQGFVFFEYDDNDLMRYEVYYQEDTPPN